MHAANRLRLILRPPTNTDMSRSDILPLVHFIYCNYYYYVIFRCHFKFTGMQCDVYVYRPLSRRLDRCDRVIQNESRDPFGGNVHYVTMQITFLTRKFRNGERNLHCDVVHITTKWVSSLTLDGNGVFAIKAYRIREMQKKIHVLLLQIFQVQSKKCWHVSHAKKRQNVTFTMFNNKMYFS